MLSTMRSPRLGVFCALCLQVGGGLFLSSCSKSATLDQEEALDQRVVRTSENVISVNKSLCEHRLTLDAARLEGATPPEYGLVLGISGSSWVRPQSLTVTVDGQAWSSSESTTTEFGGVCPEQSSVQRKFGVAAQGGCVFKESYWYAIPVEFLSRVANANKVIVRVDGVAGHVERQFSPDNVARFKEFVARNAPTTDSLAHPAPGT